MKSPIYIYLAWGLFDNFLHLEIANEYLLTVGVLRRLCQNISQLNRNIKIFDTEATQRLKRNINALCTLKYCKYKTE